jgi:hypothetical protein
LFSPPSSSTSSYFTSSLVIEDLIAQTKALSCEDPPSQIETLTPAQVIEECLLLVGQLISQKTHNNQSIHAALNKAWDFPVLFSVALLGQNIFLFKFSNQDHIEKFFKQPT